MRTGEHRVEIRERAITIPTNTDGGSLIDHVRASLEFHLKVDEIPIRYAVTESNEHHYSCEIGVISDAPAAMRERAANVFGFRKRDRSWLPGCGR